MTDAILTAVRRVREKRPLVHAITNIVTANDCANIVLAAGGAAIMAQDEREVEEITASSAALALNMGALRAQEAMLLAAREAKRLGHPVVLDPVAAGASRLRGEMCSHLLADGLVSVVRGNVSELRALAAGKGQEGGVEASALDRVTEENLAESAAWLQDFSRRTGVVALMTGGARPDNRRKTHRSAARRQRTPAPDHRRGVHAHVADRSVLRGESRYIIRSRSSGSGGDESMRRTSRAAGS